MAGTNKVTVKVSNGKYTLELETKPALAWRYVSVLGSILLFRLGGHTDFAVRVKCIEADGTKQAIPEAVSEFKLVLWVADEPRATQQVTFKTPVAEGQIGKANTDQPYFLSPPGDAELRIASIGYKPSLRQTCSFCQPPTT